MRESEGPAIAVTDDAILHEVGHLATAEGSWICPEGAACMAAVRELRSSGWIGEQERVVVLNTGTGLELSGHGAGRRTCAGARTVGVPERRVTVTT